MKCVYLVCTILFVTMIASCKNDDKEFNSMRVHIVFENASIHDLDWVNLKCEEKSLSVGVLSKGISAGLIDTRWPNVLSGKLVFVDDITRKPYSIELDLKPANEKVLTGKIQKVTFKILDYDKAEVICE